MKRKILIVGDERLLGQDFTYYLNKCENYEVISLGNNKANITDLKKLDLVLHSITREFVINYVAYTNVDLAEKERELC
jgi:dTDP-4-dehydrorhamnose reductase